MKDIFDALTHSYPIGYGFHGGFQWKCLDGHLMAYLSGDKDTRKAVGNNAPLKPEDMTDADYSEMVSKAEAEYDAAVIIPDDQSQLSSTNLVCYCGQELAK